MERNYKVNFNIECEKVFLTFLHAVKKECYKSEWAFIQFSSYPPKWAFTNPPCFVQKLLASSSKYRDCKRKGGILVYSSESSRFGGKKIKLHATLPFGNAFSKLFVLCPSSHQSLTYAVSDLIDRLWQQKYLGTKVQEGCK